MTHLKISSPFFSNNDNIPSKFTCDGGNTNPTLIIEGIPTNTKSLLLTVEDPDSQGKTWLHWGVYNIDPETNIIPENSKPKGSVEIINDFGRIGYGGPCPAVGIHRYNFKIFALDSKVDLPEDISLPELYRHINKYLIEQSTLTGLYSRE